MLYFCIAVFIFIIYGLELYAPVVHICQVKYRKFRSLQQLVSTQYSNVFAILWISFKIIIKTFYVQLCQYLNASLQQVDKNTYEVRYVINGIQYTMVVKPKRGPKCIIEAVDENDEDMTDVLISYMGPAENFHGTHLSPFYFNKNSITLSMSSGDELKFTGHQAITI